MPTSTGVNASENQWKVLPDEFLEVQLLARRTFGLDIKAGKEALVTARLNRRMRAIGVNEVRQYLRFVRGYSAF